MLSAQFAPDAYNEVSFIWVAISAKLRGYENPRNEIFRKIAIIPGEVPKGAKFTGTHSGVSDLNIKLDLDVTGRD